MNLLINLLSLDENLRIRVQCQVKASDTFWISVKSE